MRAQMQPRQKKSLGQHFLLNPVTIDQILKAADVGPKDSILEIGPGPGVMTEMLASRAQRVVAVEKDRDFARALQNRLAPFSHLSVIEGDFLEADLAALLVSAPAWKVVANLPYNVATPIIFSLLDHHSLFVSLHVMVQAEVARRLVASEGSKSYGALSIMSQLHSLNRMVLRLPPGAFTPPPKVDSAVVQFLISREPRHPIRNPALFRSVVQAAFSKRRKMIRNSLKSGLSSLPEGALDEALSASHINPKDRPEDLPIGKFVEVANVLSLRYGF